MSSNDKSWDQNAALKASLSCYDPKDLFDMDKIGLFFKMAPNKTLCDHVMNGQKKIKDWMTIGLCANINGSFKLPPLVINKHRNPCPFSRHKIKRPSNLGIY